MTNIERARDVLALARAHGARDFCVCAGSRNSPILAVLSAVSDVRLFSFVDERAAAFFALGRIKRDGAPVAVVTTSGTAVAELFAAAVEAHYSGLPLILITADRPRRFRGTGAPQAIEQEGIFGTYAETDAETWSRSRPLHVNVEFDEPLIDGAVAESRGREVAAAATQQPSNPATHTRNLATPQPFTNPLVLIGALTIDDQDRVKDFAYALQAPVYAEPPSGLREDPELDELLVRNERMLARGEFDGVIRIGGVPTLRFWRDLDEKHRHLPVINYTRLPFAGLARGEVLSLDELPDSPAPRPRGDGFLAGDREIAARIADLLDDEPQSELAMMRALSIALPEQARVYLGNSLPIREWDLAATREPRGFAIEANRGANGIDGQLSTFFGWCRPRSVNVCVIGDLTAVYDLNAPWVVPQLRSDTPFRIIVINNGGGRIFSRVASLEPLDETFRERVIENAHQLRFDDWAAMWGIDYEWSGFVALTEGEKAWTTRSVLELSPDPDASRRVWARFDELWR